MGRSLGPFNINTRPALTQNYTQLFLQYQKQQFSNLQQNEIFGLRPRRCPGRCLGLRWHHRPWSHPDSYCGGGPSCCYYHSSRGYRWDWSCWSDSWLIYCKLSRFYCQNWKICMILFERQIMQIFLFCQ